MLGRTPDHRRGRRWKRAFTGTLHKLGLKPMLPGDGERTVESTRRKAPFAKRVDRFETVPGNT